MRLAENTGRKKSAKIRHLCTITQLCRAVFLQLRHVSTMGKKLLNSNISSTCPHNMVNFGLLTAEICWRVWATPANFNGFRVLASLLHRRRSTEVKQTAGCLAVSWAGKLYTYIFGGSCPLTEFCHLQNSLASKCCFLIYWQHYCTALEQRASAKVCGVVQGMELWNFRRGHHLYLAGRPSIWASAHILSSFYFFYSFIVFIRPPLRTL